MPGHGEGEQVKVFWFFFSKKNTLSNLATGCATGTRIHIGKDPSVRRFTLALILFAGVSIAVRAQDYITMTSGVEYHDEVVGTGPEPQQGQSVTVRYTGWLYEDGAKGEKFDSSADHGGTFTFTLGKGKVIAGWDLGVATMHVGGKRTMIIPAALGYGDKGAGTAIPPNATLIFDVELVSVQ